MPKKIDRCVKDLMKQGKSESSAWAICKAANKKTGIKKIKKTGKK